MERWHNSVSWKINPRSPPASLWPGKHVKRMSIVGFFWLLCRKEYTYTGLKHKKVNVQIQKKNTSQAIPTTVARDCTIEMGQNSNVQQASYIILSFSESAWRSSCSSFLIHSFMLLYRWWEWVRWPNLCYITPCTALEKPDSLYLNPACVSKITLRQHNHTGPSGKKTNKKKLQVFK